MTTEILKPIVRVGLTMDQIDTIKMLLLEEKLAAEGHRIPRDKGTTPVEDIVKILIDIDYDVEEQIKEKE